MLQLPKTTVWLHYIAALYMGRQPDSYPSVHWAHFLSFLCLSSNSVKSGLWSTWEGKKPSLFFMLSRVSLFIALKYEQVFLWNFNAGSFAAQCLFSSAWLALQRWRCCFCGFLSVVRPKFRGTKLKPSKKKKKKKRLLYCLDCEKTHIIQPSVAILHISSHSGKYFILWNATVDSVCF